MDHAHFRFDSPPAKAITAMAHLLARLFTACSSSAANMWTRKCNNYETKYRQQQLQWVAKQAATLNMQLVPATRVVG